MRQQETIQQLILPTSDIIKQLAILPEEFDKVMIILKRMFEVVQKGYIPKGDFDKEVLNNTQLGVATLANEQEFRKFSIDAVEDVKDEEIVLVAKHLLTQPNRCSKTWISAPDDIGILFDVAKRKLPTNTVIIKVPDSDKYIIATAVGNVHDLTAEHGYTVSVAEASRNIVCAGGKPIAITNYLPSQPIMIGVLEKATNMMTIDFKHEGDLIYLIGASKNDIIASEYLHAYKNIQVSVPSVLNVPEEQNIQDIVAQLIENKAIQSALSVSGGGLFIALAEAAMANNLGFSIRTNSAYRKDAFLFGEAQSRVLVSITLDQYALFDAIIAATDVKASFLGKVKKGNFVIDAETIMATSEAKDLITKLS
ncbi:MULTISPECIES: AIR synthase-related protein [unclassified Arcicella]|uniref:AIR synthase-related protein n=1 Tax=unclassified Arcicella TaxID=2644986 RepID=UPI002865C77D|nr:MULTISPECIES: AIR synthase-related protein [unclassified Arcicella]MDR6562721.1 phosphoribosylformylglycinamidine (FGAM) synthase-like enzyme [Arcicella sp. BE51]MDR6812934.1 phosphoribosylformylglycinamidine (FGAM) synthase-like enzyme [Arcicella sp. BE140]MDR6824248.1 phosphoribosylformylglycinamidine (FGAM) synthase-like enzyme [Arcicella sp. BE139]